MSLGVLQNLASGDDDLEACLPASAKVTPATSLQKSIALQLPKNAVLKLRARPRTSSQHVQHRIARTDRVLSLEKLQSVYECPISKAAARLNIGVTVLKKYCRWYSIERWPYRKIHSVDKLMDQLNELEDDEVVAQVKQELVVIREQLLCDPTLHLDEKVKRLRQAAFKYQYKQRQQPA